MTDKVDEDNFPPHVINTLKPAEEIARQKGVTDDVAVSKGEASTFVSIVPTTNGKRKA